MQRYENQRQRGLDRNQRLLSQQLSERRLNHGMGSRALTDELSLNKSIDGDNDEYNDQS